MNAKSNRRGKLVVVSGPSGAGKTTVLKEVLRSSPVVLVPSVSATTRPPRPGEKEGVDYYFLSPQEFARRRRSGQFLECFEVFGGHWYGTPAEPVRSSLAEGKWVLLEIDVQGAVRVMEQFPDTVSVFLRAPSMEELERRLRARRTESDEAIRGRLERARAELAQAERYRYQVVNDDPHEAADRICQILASENSQSD